jgi:hypothetical protein
VSYYGRLCRSSLTQITIVFSLSPSPQTSLPQRMNSLTEREIVTSISSQLLSFLSSERFKISDYFTAETDLAIFSKFLSLLRESQEILHLFRVITSLLDYLHSNSLQPHLSCLIYDSFSSFIFTNQSIASALLRSAEDTETDLSPSLHHLLRFIEKGPSENIRRQFLEEILLLIAHSSSHKDTIFFSPLEVFTSEKVRHEILRILDYQALALKALSR